MKSVTAIENDDYLLISNPNLVMDQKIMSASYSIGSGERALFFGELQVYNTLRVEGHLDVLQGSVYNYTLNENIEQNTNIYGTINVDGTVDILANLIVL